MIEIVKALGRDIWHKTPLTWKGLQAGQGRSASVTCANGHSATLTDHQIAPDGAVTPSLVCPECDWHEFVRLIGWSDG